MTMKARVRRRDGPGRPSFLEVPKRIEVTLELEQLEALNIAAGHFGISRNDLVRSVISAWMEGRLVEVES